MSQASRERLRILLHPWDSIRSLWMCIRSEREPPRLPILLVCYITERSLLVPSLNLLPTSCSPLALLVSSATAGGGSPRRNFHSSRPSFGVAVSPQYCFFLGWRNLTYAIMSLAFMHSYGTHAPALTTANRVRVPCWRAEGFES